MQLDPLRVVIGQITTPTGKVVLLDCGNLERLQGLAHQHLLNPPVPTPAWAFELEGITAVALQGLPAGPPILVYGTRMAQGDERWRWVDLEVVQGQDATQVREIGRVAVDAARLMFLDVSGIPHWTDKRSLDGKADIVFWGLHAEILATHLQAPALGEGQFGWTDLPVAEAESRATWLEDVRAQGQHRFAYDFRPHSHHFQVLALLRESPVGVGMCSLGGGLALAFATSWGDGVFPVELHTGPTGQVVRIRIRFTDEPRPEGQVISYEQPPTPMEATKRALISNARDMATERIKEEAREQTIGRVEDAVDDVKKKISSKLWGCGCTIAFAVLFIGVLLAVAAYVAFVVMRSM